VSLNDGNWTDQEHKGQWTTERSKDFIIDSRSGKNYVHDTIQHIKEEIDGREIRVQESVQDELKECYSNRAHSEPYAIKSIPARDLPESIALKIGKALQPQPEESERLGDGIADVPTTKRCYPLPEIDVDNSSPKEIEFKTLRGGVLYPINNPNAEDPGIFLYINKKVSLSPASEAHPIYVVSIYERKAGETEAVTCDNNYNHAFGHYRQQHVFYCQCVYAFHAV